MHPLKRKNPLRRVVLASAATVSGVVLLLSLKPHTAPGLALAAPSSAPSGGGASRGSAPAGTRTVTGDAVPTRYGPVQVRITVTNGRLTDVTAVATPQDNPRDRSISGYAVPQLTREALAAQSASIDAVSGASYTSAGYRRSLQSALDKAGG
ncbi:FMN-binding protein [Streptomyces sp. RY43-2]|uniref:FMN-binding protein n=1 Tax=Streptomyces macrolidinus TaxID=2952607 RepID=A0ABT0ZAQ5_9ACTN|nr:FMN-binding protein [Streptomyces macrolidinus]MCN9240849.1 FMN-binding protein [Streptomyces macrolidinus]